MFVCMHTEAFGTEPHTEKSAALTVRKICCIMEEEIIILQCTDAI